MPGGGSSESESKVVASDVHALLQVEPMSPKSLDAGIKVKLRTSSCPSLGDQPVKKLLAPALAAGVLRGDQIIYVEELPPSKVLQDAVAGDGFHFRPNREAGQTETALHLTAYLSNEVCRLEMRAQLSHYRETATQLGGGADDDYPGWLI
jgi:hypothetical protein